IPSGPLRSRTSLLFATMRPIASSHVASRSSPLSRTSGVVSRPGSFAHGVEPYNPFGPSRPWLTASVATPRMPTIRPSLTAISQPHPLEHRTQAERTQRSTLASVTPASRWKSIRVGHSVSRACGVRGPQTSWIRSRPSPCPPWNVVVLLMRPSCSTGCARRSSVNCACNCACKRRAEHAEAAQWVLLIHGTPRPPARPDATPERRLVPVVARYSGLRHATRPVVLVSARAGHARLRDTAFLLSAGAGGGRPGPPRRGGGPAVPLPAADGAAGRHRAGACGGLRPADARATAPSTRTARQQRARVRAGPGRRPAHPGTDGDAGRDAPAGAPRACVRRVRTGLR